MGRYEKLSHYWMLESYTIDTRYFKNIWVGLDLKHRIETANFRLRKVIG